MGESLAETILRAQEEFDAAEAEIRRLAQDGLPSASPKWAGPQERRRLAVANFNAALADFVDDRIKATFATESEKATPSSGTRTLVPGSLASILGSLPDEPGEENPAPSDPN